MEGQAHQDIPDIEVLRCCFFHFVDDGELACGYIFPAVNKQSSHYNLESKC